MTAEPTTSTKGSGDKPAPSTEAACPPPAPRRIYVVEDHPFMRRSLVAALERDPLLVVCGEADDVEPALAGIAAQSPDLVLTDLELKSSHGLDLIRAMRALSPTATVVATTMFNLRHNERLAREAGATAFVSKQDGPEAMLRTIREIFLPGAHPAPDLP